MRRVLPFLIDNGQGYIRYDFGSRVFYFAEYEGVSVVLARVCVRGQLACTQLIHTQIL